MNQQQARAPNAPPPPSRETRLSQAVVSLSHAITELIRLHTEDRAAPAEHLDLLRTRRHQLSRIIDDLSRFTRPSGKPQPSNTTTRRPAPPP